MAKSKKNEKGALLILVAIIITVIAILTGAYLSRLVTEKKSFTDERGVFQAMSLSESAANMAYAELNKRLPTDLNSRLIAVNASDIRPYVTGNNPLGFLVNFAYSGSATRFSSDNSTAVLSIPLPDYLNKGSDWNTTANITITSNGTPTEDDVDGPFRFNYRYKIQAATRMWQGSGADGIKGTSDDKYVRKIISYAPNSFQVVALHGNFAKFALFTDHHKTASGTTVWFTADTNFYGPVHTNERFSFANNPSAEFTDAVSQSYGDVRFYNNGSSKLLAGNSNPLCCERSGCLTTPCRDKPIFNSTFTTSADVISLPSSVSQTEMKNDALGTLSAPSSTGVYIPNQAGSVTGGIYIKGSTSTSADDATIVMSVDGSNDPVYTITQKIGTTTHTTVVTELLSTSQTKVVVDGGAATTYNGKPDGTGNEGTLIYSSDTIKGFSGTVQSSTKITVASEKDVVITNNVKYQNYTASPLSATGYDNILGLISWGGNLRIGTAAPDDIEIHGIMMAPAGVFTVDDYNMGSPRGTATLLGGVITSYYGAFGTFSGGSSQSGYGRHFVYDSRVLSGIAPPYFPYMTSYTSSIAPQDIFRTRTSWREQES
ncbi:MAG: DUF4900 domain-containing protein [Candidatus Omnitrophica bacterium]|nr:DUF4900 domain-containing protein [Candidatus Omnitrophota bacterium]